MSFAISFWKTIICSAFMLVLFLLPANNINKAPSIPFISEAVHVFLFALFTWTLVHERVKNKLRLFPQKDDYITALIFGIIFGIVVEGLQKVCNLGRTAELLDVVYDLAGSLLSICIMIFYYRIRQNPNPKDLS